LDLESREYVVKSLDFDYFFVIDGLRQFGNRGKLTRVVVLFMLSPNATMQVNRTIDGKEINRRGGRDLNLFTRILLSFLFSISFCFCI
jgi:hypothetical protein